MRTAINVDTSYPFVVRAVEACHPRFGRRFILSRRCFTFQHYTRSCRFRRLRLLLLICDARLRWSAMAAMAIGLGSRPTPKFHFLGARITPSQEFCKIDRYLSFTYSTERLARRLARIVLASYTQLKDRINGSAKRIERSRKSAQGDKWSFCLTAGTLWPANQERP